MRRAWACGLALGLALVGTSGVATTAVAAPSDFAPRLSQAKRLELYAGRGNRDKLLFLPRLKVSGLRLTPVTETADYPGGGHTVWDMRGRAPADGRDEIIIGSVLLPFGLFRTGLGAYFLYWSTSPKCAAQLEAAGIDVGCRTFIFSGASNLSTGGLMVLTGAVFLAVGAARRRKHKRWKMGLAGRFDQGVFRF